MLPLSLLLLATATPAFAVRIVSERSLPAKLRSRTSQSLTDAVSTVSQQAEPSSSDFRDALSNLFNGTSFSSSSVTALNGETTVECARGPTLSASECTIALNSIPEIPDLFTHRVSWGPRAFGIYNVGLPRRYISPDGTCAVEVYLTRGFDVAFATPLNVLDGAFSVLLRCLYDLNLGPGKAYGFGDGRLIVQLSKFVSRAQCFGPASGSEATYNDDCAKLLDTMDASGSGRIFPSQFDRAGKPEPWSMSVGRCNLRVEGNGQYSSWYTVWEAAGAIYAQCIGKGQYGYWQNIGSSIGDLGSLDVYLNDRNFESTNLTLPSSS